MTLLVMPFFDPTTHSFSYVVTEPDSRTCAIIDPVLDYEPETGETSTINADRIVEFVLANDLIVEWLLETHVHADHLSAAAYLKQRFVCAQRGVGAGIETVRRLMAPGLPGYSDGPFDRLFNDGDRICLGHARGRVMATPGHTPACVSYRFENLVFVGDTIFMPDFGTARCDFPGGDARRLYVSIGDLLSLPETARLFMCHDYGPGGRPVRFLTTVGEQLESNIHVHRGISEADFVLFRGDRDAQLDPPALLDPAVRFNLSGSIGGEMTGKDVIAA